jgi:hypothetical protein
LKKKSVIAQLASRDPELARRRLMRSIDATLGNVRAIARLEMLKSWSIYFWLKELDLLDYLSQVRRDAASKGAPKRERYAWWLKR